MARRLCLLALAVLAALLSGCQLPDDDEGWGGSGSAGSFGRGYAFVRDREIYIADLADYQAARRLTTSGSNSDPAISADGRLVVYVHHDDSGRSSIRQVPSTGGPESELAAATGDAQLLQPAVSADASRVLYIESRGATSALHLVRADGSSDRRIPGSAFDASPSFFPNGLRALVLTGADPFRRTQLAVIELGSGARQLISFPSLSGPLGNRAAVSPDGERIAFEASVGGRSRIFAASAKGDPSTLRQVSGANTGDEDDRAPGWASATRISFASQAGGDFSNVYEVDLAEGGNARVAVPDADQASYAPGIEPERRMALQQEPAAGAGG
jgi:Tol biopolymer transport system component